MGGGHALSEGSQAPPGSEPIREPGQVTVTVEVVGVQTPERGRDRSLTLKTDFRAKDDMNTENL